MTSRGRDGRGGGRDDVDDTVPVEQLSAPVDGDDDRPLIDERIAERRREVRREARRSRLRRTIRVVVALVVVVLLVVIERSDLVALDRIEVVGLERLTEDEVLDVADLRLGTSTLRLRLGQVEERLARLPLVDRVEATRVDPLTVRLRVVERQPALVARTRTGALLLDREGRAIDVFDERAPEGLTVVTIPGELPELGEVRPVTDPLGAGVAVWRGLSGPLRSEAVRVEAPSVVNLTLHLRSGLRVRLGTADRLDEKVRAFGVVLEDLGDTPVQAIDVRAPNRPVAVP